MTCKSNIAPIVVLASVISAVLCLSSAGQAQSPAPPKQENAVWSDPATGLMWARHDNGKDVDWNEADSYCKSLTLGGMAGWRLPKIEELSAIYDKTIYVGLCHIKGDIRLSECQVWSSTKGSGEVFDFGTMDYKGDLSGKTNVDSSQAWAYDFAHGAKWPMQVSDRWAYGLPQRALCVRRLF